ncbi:Glutathione S-transferase 1 [Spathaspora sp. JA1]|nr:Glutathione S-transferase 1 [Spathaspora sp. JA1]
MSKALKLFTFATPNGFKPSIFLELLGLKYDVQVVDIHKNEQKSDWFLKLNPNGRIPTLVDSNTGITISQTGAILQYLADTYDKEHKWSYPYGTPEYYKQLEYLTFQVAENGPIQGQAGHFVLFAQEKIPYAINRYMTDVKRIYGVYEDILGRNDKGLYLVGDHYCIADIALYTWARTLTRLDLDIHDWPRLGKWFDALDKLPGVQAGLKVPSL